MQELESKEQKQQQQQQQQQELDVKIHQLQLQLQEIQEQYGTLQLQHSQQQQKAADDSAASSLLLRQLQEQLLAAQESQSVGASASAAAFADNKRIQSELQSARDRIKFLESAVSGHVARLESQAAELSGFKHPYLPENFVP